MGINLLETKSELSGSVLQCRRVSDRIAVPVLSELGVPSLEREVHQQLGLSPTHLQDTKANTYSMYSNPPTLS